MLEILVFIMILFTVPYWFNHTIDNIYIWGKRRDLGGNLLLAFLNLIILVTVVTVEVHLLLDIL